MTDAVLGFRLLVALVLAVAGAAKFFDLSGSRESLNGFAVPEAAVRVLAIALPMVEIALAGLLLFSATARWGALGAVGLMTLFSGAIAVMLRRGRRPECHCFGALHSAPVGPITLARSVALAAASAVPLVAGRVGPDAFGWVGDIGTAQAAAVVLGVVLVATLGFLGWFSLQVLAQNGRLLERLDALEGHMLGPSAARSAMAVMGAPAPTRGELADRGAAAAFELFDIRGVARDLAYVLEAGRPSLFIFTDPSCTPCNALLPEVGAWQREYQGRLTIMVVARGTADVIGVKAAEHQLWNVLLDPDGELAKRSGAVATPSAVAVSRDGRTLGVTASGADAIRRRVQVLAQTAPAAAARTAVAAEGRGDPAVLEVVRPAAPRELPDLELPQLDGPPIALRTLQGREHVLVFWNPACGFCRQALDDLQAIEQRLTDDDRPVVVIASGGAEANRGQHRGVPVLLDDGFQVGAAVGSRGTPSAVVLDADGTVVGPPAVGGPAVLALTRGRELMAAGAVGR